MYRSADYWPDAEHDADFFAHRESRRTVIGHDTWIGHGAIIKPEVTVGHGAVVAAGAVVTKDVAPYMIVAGCPAKPLRERQPPAIADRLIALAWWDWDHATPPPVAGGFPRDPAEAFLEKYETAGVLNGAGKAPTGGHAYLRSHRRRPWPGRRRRARRLHAAIPDAGRALARGPRRRHPARGEPESYYLVRARTPPASPARRWRSRCASTGPPRTTERC
jgi:hypothetical protein